MVKIQTKRIYEDASPNDGFRILVDRLWPRGISKEKAALGFWGKEFAPSHDLRKWFHQNLDEWSKFQQLYLKELLENQELIHSFFENNKAKSYTLLFGAKDVHRNHAIVLKSFLTKILD